MRSLFFFLLWYLCRWKIDIVFPIQHLHRRGGVWRGWEQTSFSLWNFGFHWNYSQRMEIVLILFFCKLQLNQPFWGTRKVVGWEKLFMERIFLFLRAQISFFTLAGAMKCKGMWKSFQTFLNETKRFQFETASIRCCDFNRRSILNGAQCRFKDESKRIDWVKLSAICRST